MQTCHKSGQHKNEIVLDNAFCSILHELTFE